jgi:hypothetical protein
MRLPRMHWLGSWPPFAGADDPSKALLYRLMQVPALRARYLDDIRQVVQQWLRWDRIGPLAQQYQAVIAADIPSDTRKLFPTEAFTRAVVEDSAVPVTDSPISAPDLGLKSFVERRRAYLLAYLHDHPNGGL